MPLLFGTGCMATTVIGISIEDQFTVFGASGALVFMLLSGLLRARFTPASTRGGVMHVALDHPVELCAVTASVQTMRAIVQNEYRPAPEDVLRLERIDKPTIGENEILVRVHAASVDRGTWHVMAGLPYPIRLAGFGLRRPKYSNPGRSLAGTIEAVGTDATGFEPVRQRARRASRSRLLAARRSRAVPHARRHPPRAWEDRSVPAHQLLLL